MSAPSPISPVVDAMIARAEAALPDSYTVHDGEGPTTPLDDVPYVVLYADSGIGDGSPMQRNRELLGTFSWRCVGSTPGQSRKGGDRIRAAFDGATFTADGRQVTTWEEQAIPVIRDDSLAPVVLFEHLIVFGLRSTL